MSVSQYPTLHCSSMVGISAQVTMQYVPSTASPDSSRGGTQRYAWPWSVGRLGQLQPGGGAMSQEPPAQVCRLVSAAHCQIQWLPSSMALPGVKSGKHVMAASWSVVNGGHPSPLLVTVVVTVVLVPEVVSVVPTHGLPDTHCSHSTSVSQAWNFQHWLQWSSDNGDQ